MDERPTRRTSGSAAPAPAGQNPPAGAGRVAKRVPVALLAVVAISVALLTGLGTPQAAPRPGTLDRGFGEGGRVVADFGTEPASDGAAEQAIPTADGGLLVLSRPSSITRYRPDGSVDSGFGRDGSIVRVEWPIAMATDSQGRIIVVSSPESPAGKVTLERFEHDGTLDRSFGSGGSRDVKIAKSRMAGSRRC